MWRVLVVIFFLLILAGINYLVVESLCWWGYFQTTYNHGVANGTKCHKLPGTGTGSADIHDVGNGHAFMTSGFRQGNGTGGKIFMVDMTSSPPTAEELFIGGSDLKHIRPLGISSWTERNDIYLYVIIREPEQAVVKLLYDDTASPEKLKYINRIANESDFVSLNDLLVVGKDQFYFTNDAKYCYVMELLFRLPLGSIGLYKDGSATLLEENLFFPNGLAQSPDKQLLYVGMSGSREIRVYTILADGTLSFNNSVKVSTSVVDVFVDQPSGDVLFAAMPVLYKFLHYFYEDPRETCVPSQIMRVKMQAGEVEEVYSNDGSEISASTSVVIYGDKMIVGTVLTDAWYCIPETSK